MKKRGFTVIEVLCVVAILLILAAVIGGSITGLKYFKESHKIF